MISIIAIQLISTDCDDITWWWSTTRLHTHTCWDTACHGRYTFAIMCIRNWLCWLHTYIYTTHVECGKAFGQFYQNLVFICLSRWKCEPGLGRVLGLAKVGWKKKGPSNLSPRLLRNSSIKRKQDILYPSVPNVLLSSPSHLEVPYVSLYLCCLFSPQPTVHNTSHVRHSCNFAQQLHSDATKLDAEQRHFDPEGWHHGAGASGHRHLWGVVPRPSGYFWTIFRYLGTILDCAILCHLSSDGHPIVAECCKML